MDQNCLLSWERESGTGWRIRQETWSKVTLTSNSTDVTEVASTSMFFLCHVTVVTVYTDDIIL